MKTYETFEKTVMDYDTIAKRIPLLIDSLDAVKTEHSFERKFIGQAQVLLALLLDMIKNERTN